MTKYIGGILAFFAAIIVALIVWVAVLHGNIGEVEDGLVACGDGLFMRGCERPAWVFDFGEVTYCSPKSEITNKEVIELILDHIGLELEYDPGYTVSGRHKLTPVTSEAETQ